MHFGIDYGSKRAGTTVITYNDGGKLHQISSSKNEDADQMIEAAAEDLRPSAIYIDAPLSLPGAYYGRGTDFFYREADRVLKAMSPMFLGGLTARAIQLKSNLNEIGIPVFETYPGGFIRSVEELFEVYNKKSKTVELPLMLQIKALFANEEIQKDPVNMHQVDSLLAWYSGKRHILGKATVVGLPDEGQIVY